MAAGGGGAMEGYMWMRRRQVGAAGESVGEQRRRRQRRGSYLKMSFCVELFILLSCGRGFLLLARSRQINFPTTIVTLVVVLNSYID